MYCYVIYYKDNIIVYAVYHIYIIIHICSRVPK